MLKLQGRPMFFESGVMDNADFGDSVTHAVSQLQEEEDWQTCLDNWIARRKKLLENVVRRQNTLEDSLDVEIRNDGLATENGVCQDVVESVSPQSVFCGNLDESVEGPTLVVERGVSIVPDKFVVALDKNECHVTGSCTEKAVPPHVSKGIVVCRNERKNKMKLSYLIKLSDLQWWKVVDVEKFSIIVKSDNNCISTEENLQLDIALREREQLLHEVNIVVPLCAYQENGHSGNRAESTVKWSPPLRAQVECKSSVFRRRPPRRAITEYEPFIFQSQFLLQRYMEFQPP